MHLHSFVASQMISSAAKCVCLIHFFRLISMFLSIRALAFLVCLGLSLTLQTEAACGESGQAQFHANSTFPQGNNGELYCAVRCILNGQYCDVNQQGKEVYPIEAKGASGSDKSKLTAYYGANISNWCVGLVENFSNTFLEQVSNVWQRTMAI
jgi:hypothetical protein